LNFYTGFYPKRKSYLRKLSRILLSKPLFKHTSLNLIIDLFIYNNKRYKFKRIKNLTVRRSIYKYMYSMYVEFYKKIKQTVNRPRFFYVNLIEPKLYYSYSNIISNYENYFIKNKNTLFIYICFLALQFNLSVKNKFIFIFKNKLSFKSSINNVKSYNDNTNTNININNIDNIYKNNNIKTNIINISTKKDNLKRLNVHLISFNRLINNIRYSYSRINRLKFKNKYSRLNKNISYYLPLYKNIYSNINIYNYNKILVNKLYSQKEISDKRNNKNENEKFSKYALLKKYLIELEKKSNKPIDLNSLTL
jgi:hypothetical protein